ncbi:MAG TPA: tetratricopeptide repeat protein [Planctomycetota bacterium]|nr:tetratricopeptide repeat protein [Planctomycetota bacterium]
MRKIIWSLAMLIPVSGIARAEESAWTLLEKGIDEYRKGRPQRAEQILDAAVRMDARCEDAWYYLGRIREDKGDTRQAVEAYNKITKDFPTFSLAAERLGDLALKAGDKEAALEHFKVHAEARPTANALMQLASVQIDLKKYDDAEASLKKAAELSKGNLDVTDLFGRLYLEAGRNEDALAAYTEIVQKIPADNTARFLRALCLQRLDRCDEAVAEMDQVLAKDPYHAMTLKALIALYKDDPAQASKVKDYQTRLARLAKSKPAPARPVKGNS